MNNRQQAANRFVSTFEQQRAEIRERVKASLDGLTLAEVNTFLDSLQIIRELVVGEAKNPIMAIVMELGLLESDSILAEWMAGKGL
jgi:hypothetical protein